MSKLLTDGFDILARLSVEELEHRVEWLERALAAYKTCLMVRRVMDNQPPDLKIPPKEWGPLVEEERRRPEAETVAAIIRRYRKE